MDQELVAQDPVDRPGARQRALPLGPRVGRLGLEARELLPGRGELLVELGQLGEVRLGRRGDERRRVEVLERLRAQAAQVAALGDVVEVGVDLVELLLRDRVELVVVAARAAQRQPHPHRARRRHPIDHVLDQELLGDDAALAVLAVVAVEGGGDSLLEGGVGEHVAGDLLDGELIERHVVVVGVDHPVTVSATSGAGRRSDTRSSRRSGPRRATRRPSARRNPPIRACGRRAARRRRASRR